MVRGEWREDYCILLMSSQLFLGVVGCVLWHCGLGFTGGSQLSWRGKVGAQRMRIAGSMRELCVTLLCAACA